MSLSHVISFDGASTDSKYSIYYIWYCYYCLVSSYVMATMSMVDVPHTFVNSPRNNQFKKLQTSIAS